MNKKKAQVSRKDDHDNPNTNEPADIEDFAAGIVAPDTDDSASREPSEDTETDSNVATFPLTRTFIHCDPTGRELAHVSVTATVTLTRVNGVTLTLSEIERRFRRNFYLSFKGGKVGLKELSTMVSQPSSSPRPRRTMSPEHKQKLQEARQRRRGNEDSKPKQDEETNNEIVKLATTLLNGFSKLEQSEGSAWFGKAAVLGACHIAAIEPAAWSLAIRYLLDTKQIEARGEKRGREYRRVKATKGANP